VRLPGRLAARALSVAGLAPAPAPAVAAALALALVSPTAAEAVVGGRPVRPGHFGYVAHVEIGGQFTCTGSLIAPQWVLTAGHCASITGSLSTGLVPSQPAWPASAYTVVLGTPYADGRGGETHSVSQVVVDSDYVVTNGVGNDVTLLRLATPSKQRPIALAPARPRLWRAGVLATIAGFGTTSESSGTPPPQMRWARVPFVSDAYCARKYPKGSNELPDDGYFDPATMVCAGYAKGGTDTCEGDSGGPLLAPVTSTEVIRGKRRPGRRRVRRRRIERTQLELVGATSFGKGCAEAGHPGVYALVAAGPIRRFIAHEVPGAGGAK
jgi:secreted trypsin-like serine protease